MASHGEPSFRLEPDAGGGFRLAVKVVPGAKRARIVGPHGGALKVTVAQPPVGGAANKAVCRLLAEALGVAVAEVEVVQGHGAPWKTVRVSGLSVVEARRRLGGVTYTGP